MDNTTVAAPSSGHGSISSHHGIRQLTRAARGLVTVFEALGSSYKPPNPSESAEAATIWARCLSAEEICRLTLFFWGGCNLYICTWQDDNPSVWNGHHIQPHLCSSPVQQWSLASSSEQTTPMHKKLFFLCWLSHVCEMEKTMSWQISLCAACKNTIVPQRERVWRM